MKQIVIWLIGCLACLSCGDDEDKFNPETWNNMEIQFHGNPLVESVEVYEVGTDELIGTYRLDGKTRKVTAHLELGNYYVARDYYGDDVPPIGFQIQPKQKTIVMLYGRYYGDDEIKLEYFP